MPQPMVTTSFRNPWALSSTLTTLGTLKPWALGFLNHLVTLVLASNYYLQTKTFGAHHAENEVVCALFNKLDEVSLKNKI